MALENLTRDLEVGSEPRNLIVNLSDRSLDGAVELFDLGFDFVCRNRLPVDAQIFLARYDDLPNPDTGETGMPFRVSMPVCGTSRSSTRPEPTPRRSSAR
jgi:hypothetical protein